MRFLLGLFIIILGMVVAAIVNRNNDHVMLSCVIGLAFAFAGMCCVGWSADHAAKRIAGKHD